MIEPSRAVFLSYASHDAEAAQRICDALRAAGIEVWFDRSELQGGDAWDQKIRRQILECALFIPIISERTEARPEGYFRLEWKLAIDRYHLMAAEKAFLVPVVLDETPEAKALVPLQFRSVQWTRMRSGEAQAAFVNRIAKLLAKPVEYPRDTQPRRVSLGTTRRLPAILSTIIATTIVVLAITISTHDGWLKRDSKLQTAAYTSVPLNIPDKSVAVLPFVDMSEKKDQEYFSDGLSEELIDHLAHAPSLKVIARTSSFQFKGKNEDMRAIGQRLGVANLLEGSVRTSKTKFRVTAQLIKVSDGSHLWSETYDRDLGDIFQVQDSIASAVVAALQATMSQVAAPTETGSGNWQSHDALLRGRYFFDKGTKLDFERASTALQEAIRLDPENASAWVLRGVLYSESGHNGWMDVGAAHTQALKAVERGLEIDPHLAAAHWMMCAQQLRANFDLQAAKAECKRARELEDNSLKGFGFESDIAAATGDLDEALRLAKKAVEASPLDPSEIFGLTIGLFDARRFQDAERTVRGLLQLYPDFSGAKCMLGDVLLFEDEADNALAVMNGEADENVRLTCIPDALWAVGRAKDADAALAQAKHVNAESFSYAIACSYATRGAADEAFKWLARAYDNREESLMFIKSDPSLSKLHDDARFHAFLRKLRLPE